MATATEWGLPLGKGQEVKGRELGRAGEGQSREAEQDRAVKTLQVKAPFGAAPATASKGWMGLDLPAQEGYSVTCETSTLPQAYHQPLVCGTQGS